MTAPSPSPSQSEHCSTARSQAPSSDVTLPLWIVLFALAVAVWAGWYIGAHAGGFRPGILDGDHINHASATGSPTELTQAQLGARTYQSCANCHQLDGRGVPGRYPPLAGSQWVTCDVQTLARIVLDGMRGPVTIGDATYDDWMPGWRLLDDERLAAVLTHVRQSWGNDAGPVEPDVVASVRSATRDRHQAWTAQRLQSLRASATKASDNPPDQGIPP